MKSLQFLTALMFVWLSNYIILPSSAVAADRLENKHLKQLLLRIYNKTGMSVPEVGDAHFPNVGFCYSTVPQWHGLQK
jgi:hypothetical protein